MNLSAFNVYINLLVPFLLAVARCMPRVVRILLKNVRIHFIHFLYAYMPFINQYIFQFSLDECFYQFTGRKLAGVLQYLSTSGSLIQLESWRVFKFATGSIVHLLAKFMVAVLCYIFEFWYPWVQLCWIFLF